MKNKLITVKIKVITMKNLLVEKFLEFLVSTFLVEKKNFRTSATYVKLSNI